EHAESRRDPGEDFPDRSLSRRGRPQNGRWRGEDEPVEVGPELEGIAQRDGPAHAVAEQEQWAVGMLGADEVEEGVQVVQCAKQAVDERAATLRAPMASM